MSQQARTLLVIILPLLVILIGGLGMPERPDDRRPTTHNFRRTHP